MKYYKVLGYLDNDVINSWRKPIGLPMGVVRLYENIYDKDENNACNIARDMIKCNYRDEKICFIVNDSNLNYSK